MTGEHDVEDWIRIGPVEVEWLEVERHPVALFTAFRYFCHNPIIPGGPKRYESLTTLFDPSIQALFPTTICIENDQQCVKRIPTGKIYLKLRKKLLVEIYPA